MASLFAAWNLFRQATRCLFCAVLCIPDRIRKACSVYILRRALLQEIAYQLQLPISQINCSSSFVQNGGDSLSAIKIASSLRSKGMYVSVAMIMRHDSIIDLMRDLMDQVQDAPWYDHTESKEALTNKYNDSDSLFAVARPAGDVHPHRPTDMQLSLIHGSQTSEGRNVIRYYETYRTHHIPLVKEAWKKIVSTESIFRMQFQLVDGEYVLTEQNDQTFWWEETTTTNRKIYATSISHCKFGLDFIGAKFKVVHLIGEHGDQESTVIWNIHHALLDRYSSVLLLNKHRRILSGLPFEPGPSFRHLLGQISSYRQVSNPESQAFWSAQDQHLQNSKSELNLASPSIPLNPVYVQESVTLGVTHGTLIEYAKRTRVTVASIYYAAWALTLSQYVDSSSVSFCVVLSGRSLPIADIESTIGPLINTVPFQVSLDSSQSVLDYLVSVFQYSLKLDEYQWSTFTYGAAKAFPSILNVHFETPLLQQNPLGLLGKSYSTMISEFPLSVDVHLDGTVQLHYHEHKYSQHDMKRLGSMFAKAIEVLVRPATTIQHCNNLLMSDYNTQLLENGNYSSLSARPRAWKETLIELIDRKVSECPLLVALEMGDTKVTYSELASMADQVAERLMKTIKLGDVICVHADRSVNWIIAIYGVLKAGGVYCPLDPTMPDDLRNQNFCQSGSSVFLACSSRDKTLKPGACIISLSVEEILQGFAQSNHKENLTRTSQEFTSISDPDAGAYLCFSSGSTGRPKGIICSHRNLVAFQKDFNVRLRSQPGWRIAQTMSPAFDGSIHEIFSALCYGSTLVLQTSAYSFDHVSKVHATILTPSMARVLDPRKFPFLRILYLVGEAVPQAVCNSWARTMTTYNMYGPTEATCGATIKELHYDEPVTLGRPNPSTRIYVLNSQMRLTPPGVIGEIYLAGVQVSHGYINRPEETALRFLPDCIDTTDGARMYRTGDRGFWDDTGELHFCGRNDRQIKLRGFRIDLDDLEIRIQEALPGCSDAAVACSDGYLVAQVQPEDLQGLDLKGLLSKALPVYALPRRIVATSSFPHTNAGKIDYKSIQKSVGTHESLVLAVPKRSSSQMDQIAEVWKDVLGLENISLNADSDFMELGGHSLLQLQVANKLSALLGHTVPLVSILQSPTLGLLADTLETAPAGNHQNRQRTYKAHSASPIEVDWYKKYQLNCGSSSFNVSFAFDLGVGVEIDRLADAWNAILDRHKVFRCHFDTMSDGVIQRKYSKVAPRVRRATKIFLKEEINEPFDPKQAHLVRVVLTQGTLLFVASHIICDYASLNVILHDVSCKYNGIDLSIPKQFDAPRQVKVNSREDLQFWQTYLHDSGKSTHSVGLWQNPTSYSGTSYVRLVPIDLFRKLRQFTLSRKITAHQVSLAAVSLALQYHTETIDIVLGAPFLGRSSNEDHDVVGLFLQPLPVRIRFPHPDSYANHRDFLQTVQASSQDALSHAIPWNVLLESLKAASEPFDTPLFDVMVSYHADFDKVKIPGIDAKPLCTWTQGAKFKLMVEFMVVNDRSLLMRLEYSDECIDKGTVLTLARLFIAALGMIVDGIPFESIKSSLSQIRGLDNSDPECRQGETFFGMSFESI